MVKVLNHPLIDIKLTHMRDKNTKHHSFRASLNEISALMAYEVFKDYATKSKEVLSPTGATAHGKDFDKEIVIVPILRAGIGMLDGLKNVLPQARVGHIGMFRDEKTFEAHNYYYRMPKVAKDSMVVVVDPMLATGNSAFDAITHLKKDGFENITLVSLVGVQEGIDKIQNAFSDVNIFLAAQDDHLNEHKYIIPGLGDAGDRIFGTEE